MKGFDAYQPEKWAESGIVIATSLHKGGLRAPIVHRLSTWTWVAASVAGLAAVVTGAPSLTTVEVGAVSTYFLPVAASMRVNQTRAFDTSAVRVPDGYWTAMQVAVRAAPRLTEREFSDNPAAAI